jgi:hypothetical protein
MQLLMLLDTNNKSSWIIHVSYTCAQCTVFGLFSNSYVTNCTIQGNGVYFCILTLWLMHVPFHLQILFFRLCDFKRAMIVQVSTYIKIIKVLITCNCIYKYIYGNFIYILHNILHLTI